MKSLCLWWNKKTKQNSESKLCSGWINSVFIGVARRGFQMMERKEEQILFFFFSFYLQAPFISPSLNSQKHKFPDTNYILSANVQSLEANSKPSSTIVLAKPGAGSRDLCRDAGRLALSCRLFLFTSSRNTFPSDMAIFEGSVILCVHEGMILMCDTKEKQVAV